jgi:hypothetical protein
MTFLATKLEAPAAAPITPESMRAKGVASATEWLDTTDGDDADANLEFRAFCRHDIVLCYDDRADLKDLLAAWEQGFDSVKPGTCQSIETPGLNC